MCIVGAHVRKYVDSNLQYVQAVIFGAPFTPSKAFLQNLPYGQPAAVYHGPTAFMPMKDPYEDARSMGIFRQVETHTYQHVNAGEIVQRILKSRQLYEERQRLKGVKAIMEEARETEQAVAASKP